MLMALMILKSSSVVAVLHFVAAVVVRTGTNYQSPGIVTSLLQPPLNPDCFSDVSVFYFHSWPMLCVSMFCSISSRWFKLWSELNKWPWQSSMPSSGYVDCQVFHPQCVFLFTYIILTEYLFITSPDWWHFIFWFVNSVILISACRQP